MKNIRNEFELEKLATDFLSAWNSQNVQRVIACYSDQFVYCDPNTRKEITGKAEFAKYLNKLFNSWAIVWSVKRVIPNRIDANGITLIWNAIFQKKVSPRAVKISGMDLILFEKNLISRNEVYFDRLALLPLADPPVSFVLSTLNRLPKQFLKGKSFIDSQKNKLFGLFEDLR